MVGHVPNLGGVLISVHKKYADAIIDGVKTVELRRRFPEIAPGTRIWIYATKPVGAVVGFVVLEKMEKAAPSSIWDRYSTRSGIDLRDFENYFEGAKVGVALSVGGARKVKSVSLEMLKETRRNFHPPQIVTRLSAEEDRTLARISGAYRYEPAGCL